MIECEVDTWAIDKTFAPLVFPHDGTDYRFEFLSPHSNSDMLFMGHSVWIMRMQHRAYTYPFDGDRIFIQWTALLIDTWVWATTKTYTIIAINFQLYYSYLSILLSHLDFIANTYAPVSHAVFRVTYIKQIMSVGAL